MWSFCWLILLTTQQMDLGTKSLSCCLLLILAELSYGKYAPIQTPALGREAELGQFYDALSETFHTQTLFNQRLSPSLIQKNEINSLSSSSRFANTLGEKTTTFGFDINLKFKIFFGLITVSVDSGYTRSDKQTTTSNTMMMNFQTRTIKQSIDVFMNDTFSLIGSDLVSTSRATHVVIGIDYGSDVVVQLEDSNKVKGVTERWHGALGAIVKALANLFQGKGPDKAIPGALSPGTKLLIKTFGDISSDSNTPKTLDEVKNFIKQVPSLTKQYNNGAGKPVMYTLLPLDALRQKFIHTAFSPQEVHEVDPGLQQQFVMTAEQMIETDALLNELLSEINKISCITPEDSLEVRTLNEDYQSYSEQFKNKVKEAAFKVREGSKDNSVLKDILSDYKANPLSAENVYFKVREELRPITEKLEMCTKFLENSISVEYWTRWSPLAEVNPGRNVYVLYYSPELARNDPQVWEESSAMFFRLGRASSNKMIVLDCEFPIHNCGGISEVQLHQYRGGVLISRNVTKEITFSEKLDPIKVPSLGRILSLGDLYNANEGEFLSRSIFSSNPSGIEQANETAQESDIFVVEDYSQKLAIAKIPPDVATNVFASQMELSGSWEFISGGIFPMKTTGVYIFSLKTGSDTVTDATFNRSLELPSAFESGATHFVHSILYGSTTVVNAELQEGTDCTKESFQQDLLRLKTFTDGLFAVKGNSSEPKKDIEFDWRTPNAKIQVYSDVLDLNLDMGTNKAGLKYFLENLQTSLMNVNEGKGKPIAYILEPLLNYRLHFGVLDIAKFKPILTLEDYRHLVKSYAEIMRAKMEMEGWITDFNEHSVCVQGGESKILEDLKEKFDKQFSLWQSELNSAIASKKPREAFANFGNLTHHFRLSKAVVLNDLEGKLGWTMEKMKMLKDGQRSKVGYSGRTSVDFKELPTDYVYVLHIKKDFKSQVALWWENMFVFRSLWNANETEKGLYFLDCDFGGSTCGDVTAPAIYEYTRGRITSQDVVGRRWGGEHVESSEEVIQNLSNLTKTMEKTLEAMANDFNSKFEASVNHTDATLNTCTATTEAEQDIRECQ